MSTKAVQLLFREQIGQGLVGQLCSSPYLDCAFYLLPRYEAWVYGTVPVRTSSNGVFYIRGNDDL